MKPAYESVLRVIGDVVVMLAVVGVFCVTVGALYVFAASQRAVAHAGIVRAIQVEPGLVFDAVVLTFEDGSVVRASAGHGEVLPGVGQRAEVLGSGTVRKGK